VADSDNLIKQLDKTYIVRDTPSGASTALAVAAEAGDTTVTVDSDATFAAGDPIRIGTEFNWIDGTPASDVITLARPLTNDWPIDTAVVEQSAYDVGPALSDGVTWSLATPSTDVLTADRRIAFAKLRGASTGRIGWQSPNFTPHHFAFATGMNLTRVTGSGTSAAPTVIQTDGGEFGEARNQAYIVEAATFGGGIRGIEFWGASSVLDNLSVNLGRGAIVQLPFSAAPSAGGMFETATYDFTTVDTYAAASGKVWDALSAVGLFVDTGTTTTLNGGLTAGATALVLTSGASFANEDWVKISGAGGVQYVQLKDKSTNNFNTKQPIFRGIATGATVTLVTKTPFAAVGGGGVTLGLSVTSTDIPDATKALPIETRIGAAALSFAVGITDITLTNLARVLGIPAADIVGSDRLPLKTDSLGTQGIDGAYLEGATKDGSATMVIVAGCDVDISNIASTWTNQGDAAELPLNLVPTSLLTIQQYT